MRHIKTTFQDISIACWKHRFLVVRLMVALSLCTALLLHFYSSFEEARSVSTGQAQAADAAEVGVGGGSYLEKSITGEETEATWSMETGVLEPEAFSKPKMVLYSNYTIRKGDIIGDLAEAFGLNEDTLISVNGIKNTRLIQIGQVLRIPNQDGILYTVKKDDTLDHIAQKYSAETEAIQFANELFSDALPGSVLFIPGAKLDWIERQEINGDLFIWPASGRITSPYGWRRWPFGEGNVRHFHSGMDIGASWGTPVRAAMSGRVSAAGWDNVLGNYIVVSHHSGYRTMYGHLSAIKVKSGAYVAAGERIGDVGSTGLSTGPHLHFTVYKNGVTVNPRNLLR